MTPDDTPLRIEDYGLVGDGTTAALVGRNGSVDWLCWPRFDSGACFAALLGDQHHGRWSIAPEVPYRVTRRYRGDTMVLETLFETEEGSVALIDFMPVPAGGLACGGGERTGSALVRIVEGRGGRVPMRLHLTLRFDYGSAVPWVTHLKPAQGPGPSAPGGITAIAGPNLVTLRTPVRLRGEDHSTGSAFTVAEGERVPFVLAHGPSHRPPPAPFDPERALAETEAVWAEWAGRCTYQGPHRAAVLRSLLTLKASIYCETGGVVAAPTTSLPEQIGGPRNWDYRYCWLRDATLSLIALMGCGYYDEARAWRDWLHRAVAGSTQSMQIMYGLAGERRLEEWEVPWLPGYEGSAPVRVGNGASNQRQLDVYGELIGALHLARAGGLSAHESGWDLQCHILKDLERLWHEPDEGIWEVRGGRRHFTFSKVGAWNAFARSIDDAERFGLHAPVARWKEIAEKIRADVLEKGFDRELGAFTQAYGATHLDASVLLLAHVGFIDARDPRMAGTVAAIEGDLLRDGFVQRYHTSSGADGLPPGEGVFLPCSFWLADLYAMQGRMDEARALFDRLVGLSNDLGLLAEEYDTERRRQVGNFPQAFSHMALVNTALRLQEPDRGPDPPKG